MIDDLTRSERLIARKSGSLPRLKPRGNTKPKISEPKKAEPAPIAKVDESFVGFDSRAKNAREFERNFWRERAKGVVDEPEDE